MLPSTLARVRLITALVLVLGVSVAQVYVATVNANGAHVGSREVFIGTVDPYIIRVETVPLVGDLHLVVYVSRLADDGPVDDAIIQAVGQGPGDDASMVGPIFGTGPTLVGPNVYSLTLPIDEAGEWTFTLTLEGSQGEITVDFAVAIQDSGEINLVMIGGIVVFLLVVGWTAISWRRKEGRRHPAKET